MRAVLDPNVIIAALLSPNGAPATLFRRWIDGAYELVVSPLLLAELERALGYPKLSRRITRDEARELVELLHAEADICSDPVGPPPVKSTDPGDDYLIALAATSSAVIVSGDRHLQRIAEIPVYSPAAFLEVVDQEAE